MITPQNARPSKFIVAALVVGALLAVVGPASGAPSPLTIEELGPNDEVLKTTTYPPAGGRRAQASGSGSSGFDANGAAAAECTALQVFGGATAGGACGRGNGNGPARPFEIPAAVSALGVNLEINGADEGSVVYDVGCGSSRGSGADVKVYVRTSATNPALAKDITVAEKDIPKHGFFKNMLSWAKLRLKGKARLQPGSKTIVVNAPKRAAGAAGGRVRVSVRVVVEGAGAAGSGGVRLTATQTANIHHVVRPKKCPPQAAPLLDSIKISTQNGHVGVTSQNGDGALLKVARDLHMATTNGKVQVHQSAAVSALNSVEAVSKRGDDVNVRVLLESMHVLTKFASEKNVNLALLEPRSPIDEVAVLAYIPDRQHFAFARDEHSAFSFKEGGRIASYNIITFTRKGTGGKKGPPSVIATSRRGLVKLHFGDKLENHHSNVQRDGGATARH